ncbi:hypothetical protein LguiA_035842 [Lonicera macranthoides]
MSLPYCKLFILIVCIAILSVQAEVDFGLTSKDFMLRRGKGQSVIHQRNSRILEHVAVEDLEPQMDISPAPSKMFDHNQSNKRRVWRGPDPIHNKC